MGVVWQGVARRDQIGRNGCDTALSDLAPIAESEPLHLHWPDAALLEQLLGTGLLLPWLQARVEALCCQADDATLEPELAALQQAAMAQDVLPWQAWCAQRQLDPDCLVGLAARRRRLASLRHGWFAAAAHEQFLQQGSLLDQVRFSVLQTLDAGLAQEWFFKLQESELDYADLASDSLGNEQHSGGSVGPVRIRELQAPLDLLLRRASPGIVQPPVLTPAGRYWVVRLDQRLPARWCEALETELVEGLFRQWLTTTLQGWLALQPLPGQPLALTLPHG
jgi:hypothetical protein